MNETVTTVIITAAATVAAAYLVYRGAKRTADVSREAAEDTSRVTAQADALEAWKELLQPYRDEVAKIRADSVLIMDELEVHRKQMARLQSEVTRWQQVARTIARWATQLRDEVLRLGGSVPATPEELLTLQAIDEAADDVATREITDQPPRRDQS